MQSKVIYENPFIIVGNSLQESMRDLLQEIKPDSLLIVCDSNTFKQCYPLYKSVFQSFSNCQCIVIENGDHSKNLESASKIWEKLISNRASRKSLIIALGGGMICDLSAFAASVYMRGISFILMPTSILAVVDASVGGKTAVNFKTLKNIIGTFKNPLAVYADLDFLKSLPAEEALSGKAEMLKHALLQGRHKFEEFANTFDEPVSMETVGESLKFKLSITEQDFEEKNVREILNLGHTVAHAIESLYLYKNNSILHGEAVAAGLWIESLISEAYFKRDSSAYSNKIRQFISEKFKRISFEEQDIPFLLQAMKSDKKNKQGRQSFVLLNDEEIYRRDCNPSGDQIQWALKSYLNYA